MPPESIDQKLDEILTILKRMQQRQLTVRQVNVAESSNPEGLAA
jgi:hypothetical protein